MVQEAKARDALALLVAEQAALRRVATLVARESSPREIFGAVADKACRVLRCEAVGLLRIEPDETATLVAQSDTPWNPPPLGTRFPLDGENVIAAVGGTNGAGIVCFKKRTGEVVWKSQNDQAAYAAPMVAAIAGVIVYSWRTPVNQKMLQVGLSLILAGALGNLYDRIVIGRVVDFLLFHYQQWSYPAFNVADSAITVGAAALIIDSFRQRRVEPSASDA